MEYLFLCNNREITSRIFYSPEEGKKEHYRFAFLNCFKLIFFAHSNSKTQRRASRFRGGAEPFWCLSAVGMSDRVQPRPTLEFCGAPRVSTTSNTLRSSRFFSKQTTMAVTAKGGFVVGRCSFWRSLSPQSRKKWNIFKTSGCLTLIQGGKIKFYGRVTGPHKHMNSLRQLAWRPVVI